MPDLIIAQPLEPPYNAEAPRFILPVCRLCTVAPGQHPFSPKVTREDWSADRSSVILENSSVCLTPHCTSQERLGRKEISLALIDALPAYPFEVRELGWGVIS